MEATSDLVVFADSQGAVLHINPAGQKMLGLAEGDLRGLTLAQLQPRWAAERVAKEGIPAARRQGRGKAKRRCSITTDMKSRFRKSSSPTRTRMAAIVFFPPLRATSPNGKKRKWICSGARSGSGC